MARLDPRALLEEAASAAERSFSSVRVRREFGALPQISADAGRLRQVFANLLTNAAQAQVSGEIVLSAAAEAGGVRVRVQDFGPGVPKDLRVFDPFETRKQGGTGLGLYVAKRPVERPGGILRLAGVPPAAPSPAAPPVSPTFSLTRL